MPNLENLDNFEEESKKEFKEVSERINDFTCLFNKHSLEYEVTFHGGSYSISIGDIKIIFNLSGSIEFINGEKE